MQRPTFKYERGEVSVEDTPIPVAGASEEDFGKIKRLIKLKAKDAPKGLYFRLAQGNFEKKGKSFKGDELAISVKGGEPVANGGDLRVPIVFKGGRAQIEVTYSWSE